MASGPFPAIFLAPKTMRVPSAVTPKVWLAAFPVSVNSGLMSILFT
jgi:hypothetical protein